MTKRPSTQLYTVLLAREVLQEFDALSPRAARAAYRLLRTGMREEPEKHGVRLRGQNVKGLLLVERANFQITYKIDHAELTVSILRIDPR